MCLLGLTTQNNLHFCFQFRPQVFTVVACGFDVNNTLSCAINKPYMISVLPHPIKLQKKGIFIGFYIIWAFFPKCSLKSTIINNVFQIKLRILNFESTNFFTKYQLNSSLSPRNYCPSQLLMTKKGSNFQDTLQMFAGVYGAFMGK